MTQYLFTALQTTVYIIWYIYTQSSSEKQGRPRYKANTLNYYRMLSLHTKLGCTCTLASDNQHHTICTDLLTNATQHFLQDPRSNLHKLIRIKTTPRGMTNPEAIDRTVETINLKRMFPFLLSMSSSNV